jgi:hypothetical protein
MRRFIPLLLAAVLSMPSIAAASSNTSRHDSGGTKWALFGIGRNHTKKAPKAKKASKAKKAKRSRKASKR